jgi:glycosyltransferase involved in cell wall biosynthesis
VTLQRTAPAPARPSSALGTAATLDHHKGIDVLLEACARIEEPLTVEIFGDGPARKELERLAARLGVDATFHGFVDDFRARIASLDLFVLPTRGDNLPVAVLEAMANAVPVVATRVGGIPELVDDESGSSFRRTIRQPWPARASACWHRRICEQTSHSAVSAVSSSTSRYTRSLGAWWRCTTSWPRNERRAA